ncbi:hypothetical protein B2J88_41180 [Rhodococcus sp. SRB_17]|nr:hypothetical protein [Rhodococcus sp. SRB_17]
MNEWHLIETLGKTPTLVSVGGNVKNWAKVSRLKPATDVLVDPVIEEIRQTKTKRVWADLPSARNKRSYRIEGIPVLGPDGSVHAVQLWIGDSGVDPTPPRIVAGFAWSLDREVFAQTLEAALMSGVRPEDHVPERTVPEYYAKSIKFDESETVFAAGLNPVDDAPVDADMSVLHADGTVMRWHMWGRGSVEPGERGLRLLWHDVTDTTPPRRPTLAELGLQESMKGSGIHTAVFCTKPAVLALWLSEPAPWVKWRNIAGANVVMHVDDQHLLSSAQDKFNLGSTEPVSVVARLLTDDDDWQPSNLRISPYPGRLSELLVIVQISPIADEDY